MATVNLMGAPPVSGIETVQLSYLAWLESEENDRAGKYATFRDYYEGEHATQLTKRLRKFLELKDDQEFNLNMCPIVVDALAEKLKVARFETKTNADLLAEWWAKNRMDGMQAVVHLSAVRDGDTYLLVEWDNDGERPRFTQENAYNGSEGMHLVYSDERRQIPIVAIKRWTITSGPNVKTRRTNLYYPDHIEKYTDLGSGQAWQRYTDEADPRWPIPWDDNGAPLGIPVIHFRNKDQGYSYGESELEDVVPMQNGLNKTVIDLLAAADASAFQIPWMTGGKPENMIFAPGSWVWTTDKDVKVGTITPADLAGLIALKDSIAADIGKITRTPLSFFQLTGQVAAAGTLKEQRSGIIAKARDRQTVFGNAWEDALSMACRLHNAFETGKLNLEDEITTVWEDDEKPEPKELAEQVELLSRAEAASTQTKVQILHPGWSEKQIAAEVALILAETGQAVPEIGAVA